MTAASQTVRDRDTHPAVYLSAYENTAAERAAAAAVVRWAGDRGDPEGAAVVVAALGLTP